jgi:ribosomal protein S27E
MSWLKHLGRRRRPSDEDSRPERYSLAGVPIRCPHCGGDLFKAGEAQLNTALATLLELDWVNRSATVLICASCSQIQWFMEPPLKIF